jgi:NADPH:quinone reductase-like Zn-dependent oxidoreductase
MKSAVRCSYGKPDILTIKEIPRPGPKANQILVRIHAWLGLECAIAVVKAT